jgi:aspartyl-tRNA(Asn)/glutamyl-tRNA(Gln) amidotransferase subunit A
MGNVDITQVTVKKAGELLSQGECSSEALTQALIARIEAVDPDIRAYVSLEKEMALQQARNADAARLQGKTGPLLGVPIGVKDLLNVTGQPCTCSSKILEGYCAPYDATVIARLREAGAIFVGRTNMDEFAMGSSTENSAMQVTRNPVDLERVPGGSSGGSAAALAAGEAIATLGTDTGGSIRQPAAFCGCVGLKPTYGRVSRYGLTAFASSLDQVGPMTHTVEDAAILMGVIAGQDPMDSTTLATPVPDYTHALQGDLKGMRLGLPKEYFVDGMDVSVRESILRAVDACRALGADIVEVSLPHTEYSIAVYYIIATAEASANLARFDGVRYGRRVSHGGDPVAMYGATRAAGFGAEVKRRIILGTYVLSSGYYDAYYLRAQKVRRLILQDFEKAFSFCDALLTPATPTPAFRVGENTSDPLKMYLSDVFTATANLAGICALSVPSYPTPEGLPVGLQVLGPALGEMQVLRVGHAFEQFAKREKA